MVKYLQLPCSRHLKLISGAPLGCKVSIRFHPPKPPWPRKTEIELQLVTDDSRNLYGRRTELPRIRPVIYEKQTDASWREFKL